MAGNKMGYIKGKLGLKGKTKPGEILAKYNGMKCKSCGMMHKPGSNIKHKAASIGDKNYPDPDVTVESIMARPRDWGAWGTPPKDDEEKDSTVRLDATRTIGTTWDGYKRIYKKPVPPRPTKFTTDGGKLRTVKGSSQFVNATPEAKAYWDAKNNPNNWKNKSTKMNNTKKSKSLPGFIKRFIPGMSTFSRNAKNVMQYKKTKKHGK